MSIIHVRLPEGTPQKELPFYLTMEEWLAREKGDMELFFMWQIPPTVIFGRNQEIDKEVNIAYCREKGIRFYRRKSGGGCVYADMDNIMFSYVTSTDKVADSFKAYTERVAAMLRGLGLDAMAGGRNDVTIGGRKVSGNAYYHIPGRGMMHGTMLFSTNMENMLNAITPSRSKLESKKVQSVASHITTLSEHLPDLDIEDFKRYASRKMSDGEITLTMEDVAAIEKMSEPYYTEHWIMGQSPDKGTGRLRCRKDGVGEFSISVDVDKDSGRITDVDLRGDFFLTGDLDSMLIDKLKGVPATEESIRKASEALNAGEVISGMTPEFLTELITSAVNR